MKIIGKEFVKDIWEFERLVADQDYILLDTIGLANIEFISWDEYLGNDFDSYILELKDACKVVEFVCYDKRLDCYTTIYAKNKNRG